MTASNNLLLDCDPGVESSPTIASGVDYYWITDQKSVANTTSVSLMGYFISAYSDEARQMISKLKGFKNLGENWDSYGAVPPSSETIDNAIRFVKKADRNLLPFFFTAPGPNGEVVIEFKQGNKEASVYFNPEGTSELLLNSNNETVLEGPLEENYRDLLNFINT